MSGYDFQHLKVLIADDSRHIRALVGTFLRGFGVRFVSEAADTETAFSEVVSFGPDLVIVDWNMPTTNGIELVKRIRRSPDTPNPYVPIIMLTGYTEIFRVKEARDCGINAFVAKPVSANALYKRLVGVVDDQRPYVRSNEFFGPCRRAGRADDYGGADRRAARRAH